MNDKTVNYRESMAICKECGREFTAKIYNVLGHEIIQSYCRECSDKLVAIEKQKEESARQIEITAQRRRWRENCGIDLRYMSKDFSAFKTDKPGNIAGIYQKCLEYAGNFPIDYDNRTAKDKTYPSLLLFSLNWGNGKTHLVSAIAHKILDRWNGENIANPVYLISEPEIYERIQQTYSYTYQERENKQSEQEIIDRLSRVRLLIIDDLGKTPRRDMDFVRRTMFSIINRRYKSLLPVVITTNKDMVGLRDYLGGASDQATLDRIIEMTADNVWHVTCESYRRQI
jgi:DNA replication protein DnaC